MIVLSSLMRFMQVLVLCVFALLSNAHAGINVINVINVELRRQPWHR